MRNNTTLQIHRKLVLLVGALLLINFNYFAQNEEEETTTKDSSRVMGADINVIIPPTGFLAKQEINGYLNPEYSAGIILSVVPGVSYLKIMEGMTEDFFSTNKLVKVSEEKMTSANGTKGVLYIATFMLEGIEFMRYTALYGDLSKTIWVNITYPSKYKELMDDEMRKSLNTLTLTPEKR
jgi:hypothetical protein